MKKVFFITIILFLLLDVKAQQNRKSDISYLLKDLATTNDTNKIIALRATAERYIGYKNDSSLLLVRQALELARKMNFEPGEIVCLFTMGKIFVYMGNYSRGLDLYFQSLQLSEDTKGTDQESRKESIQWQARNFNQIGQLYSLQKDYGQALAYFFKAISIAESNHMKSELATALLNTGKAYENMNMLDSARIYIQQGYELSQKNKEDEYLISKMLFSLGELYLKTNDFPKAIEFYRLSFERSKMMSEYLSFCISSLGIATVYNKTGETDSSIYFARQSLQVAQQSDFLQQSLNAVNLLAQNFKQKKMPDSTIAYMEMGAALNDSLISEEKIREFEKITFTEEYRQQGIEQEQLKYNNKIKIIILISILVIVIAVALVLWRSVWTKQRANKLLTAQKQEIDKQKVEIENSFQELKSTQAQLIQSEKMASLGELTAGIAHEIQNPLNFVNNFSEVNKEMVVEATEEINRGNYNEAKFILNDIKDNSDKINHHGKRADAIVKGMLQHSRQTKGGKELTDINALCDEYLRLSYHGLRAKDKSFAADFTTDFDESIGKINIVPQDIGRVLLNLYNNAFYAVNEKAKQQTNGYDPMISVSTKKTESGVTITVSDNGNGIPQNIVDKIFQPFFTTKPTGQGTGLGLSLSYDIITKEHHGILKVESVEGVGSEFTIQLPEK